MLIYDYSGLRNDSQGGSKLIHEKRKNKVNIKETIHRSLLLLLSFFCSFTVDIMRFFSFCIYFNTHTRTHFFHSQAFPMNFALCARTERNTLFFSLIYLWYNLFVVRTHVIKINIVYSIVESISYRVCIFEFFGFFCCCYSQNRVFVVGLWCSSHCQCYIYTICMYSIQIHKFKSISSYIYHKP